MFRKFTLASFAAAAFAFAAAGPANADGNIVLKAHQGFSFAKGAVTKSGDPNADVTFVVNGGHAAIVGARKIKSFGSQVPGMSAFNDIRTWSNTVDAPEPGYYVVQGRDGKTVYIMQVTSLNNDGPTKWELDASWEKLW